MTYGALNLVDLVEHNSRMHGERLAFAFAEKRISHSEYERRTARLATGLALAGVVPGDRCAIVANNCLEYVELLGASSRLGAIVVPINFRWSGSEVEHVLNETRPKVVFVSPLHLGLVTGAHFSGLACYVIGSRLAELPSMEELYVDGAHPAIFFDDAPLMMLFTAAVSGRPKGAVLSQRNLLTAANLTRLAWQLRPDDANVGVLPLFHVTGIDMLLAVQLAGGSTWLMPSFDAVEIVRSIGENAGSVMATFPPMLERVLDAAAARPDALATLRVVSGIDSFDIIRRLQADHPTTHFWSTYGQTETSGFVTLSPFDERPGSSGRPTLPGCVGIADDSGRLLTPGVVGEIVVRGPLVFQGYWSVHDNFAHQRPETWHRTGDLGKIDANGYLWYLGPAGSKSLIKSGGENVYPAEVERVLLEHPAIAEAVVFGVPDEQWGEAVKAVCVLRPGHELDPEALISFVGEHVARYKKPKLVEFARDLPRSAAGLIDRIGAKRTFGK